jgi:hypothetical protein
MFQFLKLRRVALGSKYSRAIIERCATLACRLLAVRPEGANHHWREIPPRELSIDLEADERLGRATGRAGAS